MVRPPTSLLAALAGLCVMALVAMHGISGHGHSPELPSAVGLVGSLTSVAAHHHGHHGGDPGAAHDDQGGHEDPCRSCSHGAAALCALIVLGAAVSSRRIVLSVPVIWMARLARASRTWSPDPPVPRSYLFLQTV